MIRTGTACCRYSELAVGDQLCDALTITETHVVLAAVVFNDPGPNHVNALHAAANRFGQRIAHGPLLVGVMDGALGNVLGSTIVALLEQHARFLHPVLFGDTVLCRWRVAALAAKPRFGGGGIVTFEGEAHNQDDALLAEMTAVLAVADQPIWQPYRSVEAANPTPERPSPR
jgi:3-hydroxybutyryl-CoA dehydratase